MMKKNLAKFLAIVMVVSALAFSGIPVFADFTGTQTGYGSQSSSSNDVMTWSLSVTSTYASSSGSLLNSYVGNVHCHVVVTGNSAQSTTTQSNSESLNGNGVSAEIAFIDVRLPINYTHHAHQIYYGYNSGEYLQVNWNLWVDTWTTHSEGWVDPGYTCWVETEAWDCMDVTATSGRNYSVADRGCDGGEAEVYFS